MKKEFLKTHNYKILKTYTPEEIKAYGNAEFFLDEKVTDKRIKLRRAHILNKIGYQCSTEGCELTGFHFGLGVDNGGGIHLDLYGYDKDGDLVMITIDHIKPKSKGGKNRNSNYKPMCKPHNEMKANHYNFKRQFKDLCLIYPDEPMASKNYEIRKEILEQKDIDAFKNLGGFLAKEYGDYFVAGEQHVQLIKRGEGVMMSDHPSETMSNQDFINHAYGDVLIFGLGLGMIIFPFLQDKDVSSITVVEFDEGVIDMVGSIIKEHDYFNKVKIVHGDAFTYHEKLPNNTKFDTVYFDIWIRIDEKAFGEMEQLHDLYRKFLRSPLSYMNSWCYDMQNLYRKHDET